MPLVRCSGGLLLWATLVVAGSTTKTENLLVVMTDGLRRQEVFTGAHESLLTRDRGSVAEQPLAAAPRFDVISQPK